MMEGSLRKRIAFLKASCLFCLAPMMLWRTLRSDVVADVLAMALRPACAQSSLPCRGRLLRSTSFSYLSLQYPCSVVDQLTEQVTRRVQS
jgi:hypothetical protein